jgi:hypothetical protein
MDGLARTIGEIVPLAVAVAFTMLPIIATLVVLVGSQHATRGFLLTAGYAAGLALMSGLATFGLLHVGLPRFDIAPAVFIVVGLLLLALCGLRFARRGRASTHPSRSPALLGRLQRLNRPGALGIGFQFAFHPENLLLIGAASTKIVAASLPGGGPAIVLSTFCAISVSTVLVPSIIYGVAGSSMKSTLERLRDWLLTNSTKITFALLCAAGLFLIAYGAWKILTAQ